MLKPLVIYHGGCADGFTAAWVAHRALDGNVELCARNHNDPSPLPEVEGRTVYILDFSLPRHQTKDVMRSAGSVVILDHHATARDAIGDLDGVLGAKVVLDMDRSGAALAWDYFFPTEGRPLLVNYVQDHDLWRHALPWSVPVSAFIASTPYTIQAWDEMSKITVAELAHRGSAILRYQRTLIDQAKRQARFTTFGDATLMLVCSTVLFSDIAGELATEHPECDFGAAYFIRADGKVQFSLRGRGDFNVGEFAARHGGGGHPNASGFEMNLVDALPLIRP